MAPGRGLAGVLSVAALLAGVCSACGIGGGGNDLPEYDSLESARRAVDAQLDCLDQAPDSTTVFGVNGQVATDSVKCTETVEIFHFDSAESRDETYSILADAATPGRSVYFAEGRNWFVVDFSEVAAGGGSTGTRNLSILAEHLGAKYTEVD